MRLVFFGPPGAGKGTIAAKLAAAWKIPHISTGELFRAAIKNETGLGKQVKVMLDAGELVPDRLTVDLVKERLSDDDVNEGCILDGFPRTIPQAEALSGFFPLDRVVNLVVDDATVIARLSGRRVCTNCGHSYHIVFLPPKKDGVCDNCGNELIQREDDSEESIKNRLSVYSEQTEPLVDYYRKKDLIADVDGAPDPDTVYASVLKALS